MAFDLLPSVAPFGTMARSSAGHLHTHLCRARHLATNLAIDPDLLDRALLIGGEGTKKATVTTALMEYIARREQAGVLDLFGTVDWDANYDDKAERSRG
ncbi:type II toxin-antitoxin system VapB family antitoxin [Nostocoides vanveenii]